MGGRSLTSAAPPALREDDHVRGKPEGPLVVAYADFTCPRCALAWERLRDVPVRLVFRHFALKAKHPRAVAVAQASEAVARQDPEAFWAFAARLYADQGRIDDPHLWAHVQALGLDLEAFEADRRCPEVAGRVARDVRDGLRAGVTVTPTLFAGGVRHPGPPDAELLERLDSRAGHPRDR